MSMVLLLSFPSAPATFSEPADTLAHLLPKLTRAVGTRLEADRTAGSQVLLIRVQGMEKGRLLALVADVTGGRWEMASDGAYRLRLGAAELGALGGEEAKERQTWLAKAIASPNVPARFPTPDGWPFLRALASSIGALDLARLERGTRHVWSTQPGPNERTLSASVENIAREVVAAHQAKVDAALKAGLDVPPEFSRALHQKPALLRLAARRGKTSDDVGLGYELRAENGSVMASGQGRLPQPTEAPDPDLVGRMPVPPHPFSRSILGWAAVAAGRGKTSPTDLAAFLHPESHEPLALTLGPALEETAQTLNVGVVACLPDEGFGLPFENVAKAGVSKALPAALSGCGLRTRVEDGVLVGRLVNRRADVEGRTDRAALRSRIANVERNGRLNYLGWEPIGFEYDYLSALPADLYHELYHWEWPWTFPSIWTSLTPAQQARALNGGLPLREIPQAVSRITEALQGSPLTEPDEISLPMAFDVRPFLGNAILTAEVKDTPIVLVVPAGRLLPEPYDFDALRAPLDLEHGDPGFRDPSALYFPAVRRTVALTFSIDRPGARINLTQSPFEMVFRTNDGASHYPGLFPALRKALDQSQSE